MKPLRLPPLLLSLVLCAAAPAGAGAACGPFLQPLPDTSAALFPPGLVSEGRASSAVYGRDAGEVVFVVWPVPGSGALPVLRVTRRTASGWSKPVPALPDRAFFRAGPAVSPDGARLYFESNERAAVPAREDTDVWVADRQGEAWGDAWPLGPPFDSPYNEHYVTVSAHGTLCFNSSRPDGLGENDLYCSARVDGRWEAPHPLGPVVNTPHTEAAAYLDPDERFLLFASDRPGGHGDFDLYASVRRDGQWQAPVNLGPAVNTPREEWSPEVSPDGTRLLFQRNEGGPGPGARTVLYEIPFDVRRLEPPPAGGWARIDTAGPPFRFLSAVAYDAAHDRVVLFGGAVGNRREAGDTWVWDGAGWREAGGAGPEARYGHEMVYDARQGVALLFGGATHQQRYFAETWAWDGAAWHVVSAEGPPVRRSHAMAYDRSRGHTLVFGGFDGERFLNDTWQWDGARWTQLARGGPPPRYGARMAYDERRDRFVLFGGIDHSGGRFTDTWEWDGRQWTEARPAVHPAATHVALAYDPATARTHLVAGSIGGETPLREHWTWDGTAWRQEPTTFPFTPGAGFDVMVHDRRRNRLLWLAPSTPGAALTTWRLPLADD